MQSNNASTVNDVRHFNSQVGQLSRGSPGRNDMSPTSQLPNNVEHNNVTTSNIQSRVQDSGHSAVPEMAQQFVGIGTSQRPAQIPPRARSAVLPLTVIVY